MLLHNLSSTQLLGMLCPNALQSDTYAPTSSTS
jgi:hypothetical protein